MPRVRISTTVDPDVLAQARALDPLASDASLVERALRALLAQHRRAEVDEAYARAYAEQPLDAPDDWGDLESFGAAVRRR
jgi:Arc/MetJ family transcription regulator